MPKCFFKKLTALFTALVMVTTGSFLYAGASGDINADGRVDATDVVKLRAEVLAGNNNADGDMNGDGKCDTADVVLLKAYIMGTMLEIKDNVAYQKDVTASSCPTEGGETALASLTDGSGSTYTALAQQDNAGWFCVDLGGEYDINRVDLHWGNNGFNSESCPTGYIIEVKSYAHSDWQTVATVTDGAEGLRSVGFSSSRACMVRVSVTHCTQPAALGDIAVYRTVIDGQALVERGYTVDVTADLGMEPGTVITLEELQAMQQGARSECFSKLAEHSNQVLWFIGDSAFCGDVYFDGDSGNNTPATGDTLPNITTYQLNDIMGCHATGYSDPNVFTYINDAYFGRKVLNIYNATRYNQNADITVIHAGINDGEPSDSTPLDLFAVQLASLLMREIARGSYVIYMLPMETSYSESFEYYMEQNNALGMFAVRSRRYREVAQSVCEALGVEIFDTPKAQGGILYEEETMDTIHPSSNGRMVIGSRLSAFIASGELPAIENGDIIDPASEKIRLFYDENSEISDGKLVIGADSTVYLALNPGEDNLCMYPVFRSLNGRAVLCIPPLDYSPRINDPYALEGLTAPASFSSYSIITSVNGLTAQYGSNGLLEGNFIANSQDGICLVGIYSSGGCVIDSFEFVAYSSLSR